MTDGWTIVTSAAVGALSASVIGAINGWRERTARRKELLLGKAIDLAVIRREMIMRTVDRTPGATLAIENDVSLAAENYKVLLHLLKNDELPKEFVESAREALETYRATEAARKKHELQSMVEGQFPPNPWR